MTRNQIRESLIDKLNINGTLIAVYEDMVDDYMKFYDIKEELQQDIKTRGANCLEYNSSGLKVMKENPSVKQLHNTNKQMLAILKSLNICSDAEKETDDELTDFLKGKKMISG